MKCQACNEPATCHVTDIVGGKPFEYHVCEEHLDTLDTLKGQQPKSPPWDQLGILEAFADPAARQKMAAYLLPALCLALLDVQPEVRIRAADWLMALGSDAQSALGALQDALADPDERVRCVAAFVIEHIRKTRPPTRNQAAMAGIALALSIERVRKPRPAGPSL